MSCFHIGIEGKVSLIEKTLDEVGEILGFTRLPEHSYGNGTTQHISISFNESEEVDRKFVKDSINNHLEEKGLKQEKGGDLIEGMMRVFNVVRIPFKQRSYS